MTKYGLTDTFSGLYIFQLLYFKVSVWKYKDTDCIIKLNLDEYKHEYIMSCARRISRITFWAKK